MCEVLFSPKTTVNVVLATCMVAQEAGVAFTLPFVLVLAIVTTELSMASPGITSAMVIMLETLAMPTGNVGLFAAYMVLTSNYSTGVVEAYSLFEEYEAAHKFGALRDTDRVAGKGGTPSS